MTHRIRGATPDEIQQCLAAIRAFCEVLGEPLEGHPAKVDVLRGAAGRTVYVMFDDPDNLPIGSVYRTWVIPLDAKPVKVSSFRSRKGEDGDETLP